MSLPIVITAKCFKIVLDFELFDTANTKSPCLDYTTFYMKRHRIANQSLLIKLGASIIFVVFENF